MRRAARLTRPGGAPRFREQTIATTPQRFQAQTLALFDKLNTVHAEAERVAEGRERARAREILCAAWAGQARPGVR